MEHLCKTCRWWVDPPERLDRYENVKQCTSPKVLHGASSVSLGDGKQSLSTDSDRDNHVLSGDEAGVVDGSGYFAALFPAPDFGCIHWDGK